MFEITARKKLTDEVTFMSIRAPRIAAKRKAGQFIMLRAHEDGERIPLTMVGGDVTAGTINIIYQVVGRSTREFDRLKVGDSFLDVVGPLGHATEIDNFGTVVCVGGGIGTAPIYPIACALKAKGNRLISIVGARSSRLLILAEEMKALSDECHITTDDGSVGRKGFVTDVLKEVLGREKVGVVFAIGPAIMMKFVCNLTKTFNTRTIVSLNAIMIDGTGMCGGCRVTVGNETRFTCVDGPEFDGHAVNFDELMKRLTMYTCQEKESVCRLEQAVAKDAHHG
ncbi:MAG: sulfide/dihydroorotate dehydrogenase-like FAD/NAD-binding protein [Planctomycetota bacterium]